MPHPPTIGFKQSVKFFSAKFSLPTDPPKFSPSKVYRYTVIREECWYNDDVTLLFHDWSVSYLNDKADCRASYLHSAVSVKKIYRFPGPSVRMRGIENSYSNFQFATGLMDCQSRIMLILHF